MKQQSDLENQARNVEGIDFEKLAIVFKKNVLWVILIFLACNLTSILFLRYTRDLFESESELKLDVKSDATDLGISVMGDQSMNTVSGEIEQMKSKLFITRLIDSWFLIFDRARARVRADGLNIECRTRNFEL